MGEELPETLLTNVHEILPIRPEQVTCRGSYSYYHYFCDGVADMGWGCGYRTLQTLCSWVQYQHKNNCAPKSGKSCAVPRIGDIQSALVKMGDKSETFAGSKQWIGSFEVCLCLDYFYDVPCKIIHVPKGNQLEQHLPELSTHFQTCGAPVMMGGETDNSSKGIMGVCEDPPAMLVVDPHYLKDKTTPASSSILQDGGWVRWVELHELHADSFYNLCLPKLNAS
ncbi:ufm1-specific protease 1-like [Elysia marginata]|uniref:Ufm1-specific protease 1-like n=1 Tax=Elysia marginata TaxID=1093978 RepID=A0AAV4EK35_9GAST|nr:ufm1-specific protease 1-like [Elysia marginata]